MPLLDTTLPDDSHCLIIEPSKPFQMTVKSLILEMGTSNVAVVADGEQGIKHCQQYDIDLIVCNLHLGIARRNGFEVLEELRLRGDIKPTTVFVIITGDNSRSMVLSSLERHPDDYVIIPFAQQQLQHRLVRAYNKRQALRAIYEAIAVDQYQRAAEYCQQQINNSSPFKHNCHEILIQIYWKTEQFEQAQRLAIDLKQHHAYPWLDTALAYTALLKSDYHAAIDYAKTAIAQSENNVSGFDIITEAALELGDGALAMDNVGQALKLAPHSIWRLQRMAKVARFIGDLDTTVKCNLRIWEESKRGVYRDLRYACHYVRSLLDKAESLTTMAERNRFLQEASLTMQRFKVNGIFTRKRDEFPAAAYETLVDIRIMTLNGALKPAKKSFSELFATLHEHLAPPPNELLPDIIKLLFDFCEYDDAEEMSVILLNGNARIDEEIEDLLARERKRSKESRRTLEQCVHKGLKAYKDGRYSESIEQFLMAKTLAPYNTAVNINLMYALYQQLNDNPRPSIERIKQLRECFRLLSHLTLMPTHQRRYNAVKEEVDRLIGKHLG